MDRDKVIKGLEHCISESEYTDDNPCNGCPYFVSDQYGCDRTQMEKDALALLKKQEAEWIEYPKCLAYDGAYSDSHIVCSACKHVFSIMDNCTEEFDYCPHCGAKMEGIKPTKTNAKSNSLDAR